MAARQALQQGRLELRGTKDVEFTFDASQDTLALLLDDQVLGGAVAELRDALRSYNARG